MMLTFKGVEVTTHRIENALRDFDDQYPDTNEYDQWLEKKNYKYTVVWNGKRYPCKYILSLVTGIVVSDLHGGEPANKVFRRLGFRVVEKP